LQALQELLPKLNIVNLVATADLNQLVNLQMLVGIEGFRYDPTVYRCAYLKDSEMKGKVSIFSTGRMICVGAKGLEDARLDLEYAARKVAKLRLIKPTKLVVKLRNIVATGGLGKPIDIERLATRPNVLYEPEQFSGAIYYAEELEGASVLVFASGKVVFAGLKSLRLLESARHILRKLDE